MGVTAVDEKQYPCFSKEELEQLARIAGREGGREGAKEVMLEMGLDVNSPIDMQADHRYLRNLRMMAERIRFAAAWTVVTAAVSGLALLVVSFFKGK